MSKLPSFLIQEKMDAVDRRWRWLKFGEHFFAAGAIFSLIWLVFELCAWRGVFTATWIFFLFTALFVLAAMMAFCAIAMVVVGKGVQRKWLADRLERGNPGLLDRVNTLVFLEGAQRPGMFALKRRIEMQAAEVLEAKPAAIRFSHRRVWERLGEFTLLLTAAIVFAQHYHPFAKLVGASAASARKNDTPFELVPGTVNESSTKQKPWGEVRIVNPGRDVKLTKIDVLQLQIEMAASGKLQNPAWITSISGGPEVRHDLPAAIERQYAVFQPLVYLDELKVVDWDVVSYYAEVATSTPATYASKIYFIDIRPFREDILKQTGGGSGKGKKGRELLDEINEKITLQTAMLQQTHQYQRTDYPKPEMRKQDSKKLVDGEKALAVGTNHLYGKIVAEHENAPIGDILDHLTQAEEQMDKATENLRMDVASEAKQREQGAITELIASRKSFFKVISENPDAFGQPSEDGDTTPTAQDSQKLLAKVTEMRDRDQAALKYLHDLSQEQQNLAQASAANDSADGASDAKSARTESDLKKKVEKLIQDYPDLFRGADSEKASLKSDMFEAIQSLGKNDSSEGNHYLSHAAGDMNDLEKAALKNYQLQRMAQAYKLKKIIDQNIQQLGQEKDKAGALSPQDIQALTNSAKRSTGILKEIADTPGGQGFWPGLDQSLSPEKQQELQKALDQLNQSTPGSGSQAAASRAQGNLAQVSKALEESQPGNGGKGAGQSGPQAAPSDGIDQALQELRGLILAQEKKTPPSDELQNKAISEIFGELEGALSKKTTPAAVALLQEVEDMKKQKKNLPMKGSELKKLLDKIESLSAEANDPNKKKQPGEQITVIDETKLPPAYRARIRVYYEQLSNRSQ